MKRKIGIFGAKSEILPKEEEKRMHRCAFTGHRPEKLDRSETEIKQSLKVVILRAITDGYNVFITGMARGVDLWAAEIVLDLKREYEDIRLICALPYDGFELRWSQEWITKYRLVLRKADYVHVVSAGYFRGAFDKRNVWMVDHSARIIAVYNGIAGGTRNTIEYAKKAGVEVEIV